ncbi:hypothetical protein [Pandoraea communis]|uniref:hypothetical protein n=1 Tax=Pandoraea communis TaxID=2508297 RepID=UPI0025A64FAB|nr:hypothetical protein [Pandoraea communis]MDM8359018.1 hypothetical protein [Pandoraea communis]
MKDVKTVVGASVMVGATMFVGFLVFVRELLDHPVLWRALIALIVVFLAPMFVFVRIGRAKSRAAVIGFDGEALRSTPVHEARMPPLFNDGSADAQMDIYGLNTRHDDTH